MVDHKNCEHTCMQQPPDLPQPGAQQWGWFHSVAIGF